jgi:hypothetical protein
MPYRSYRFLPPMLVLLLAPSADATTRRVPSEFATIQAGIEAALVGDTVLVAPGTYTGVGNFNITFNGKDLVLISEAGPDVTTIDAQGTTSATRRGFFLDSGETAAARIQGFTITGGRTHDFSPRPGAGILCYGSSPTIVNCVLKRNWAGDGEPAWGSSKQEGTSLGCGIGGGIALFSSSAQIIDCIVTENGATCGPGGGLAFWDCPSVVVRGCLVTNNIAGGIAASRASSSFENCTVSGNLDAWGIELWSSTGLFERSIIWGNCGDLALQNSSSAQLACCLVDSSQISDSVSYVGPNVFADPLFCAADVCPGPWPRVDVDFRLQATSPCLPENNSCGVLIGALGSCAATSVPPSFQPPDDAIWASPNPFSTSTSLSLGASLDRDVMLSVFDVAGRRVREFRITPAAAPVVWDGADESGQRVAAGTYLLQLEGAQNRTGRVTIVR